MKSRANIAGHPLHPIFVAIPIGLWSFVPVCDLVYFLGFGDISWERAALYCAGGGIIGAVPALITGYMDYGIVPSGQASKIAGFHLRLNLLVTILFISSFVLRFHELSSSPRLWPAVITLLGTVLLSISGWLGGELVTKHGISVHPGAE